jgi:uncharacterized RDD family membrane protein YckC
VTKTCLLCGAILPSRVGACYFCETAAQKPPLLEDAATPRTFDAQSALLGEENAEWRDELARRLEVYRGRRRKTERHADQSRLPFETAAPPPVNRNSARQTEAPPGRMEEQRTLAATAEIPSTSEPPPREEFSFTIAIGRPPKKRDDETRMVIDVSLPPENPAALPDEPFVSAAMERQGLYGAASIEQRRLAALVDAACLAFAYGAFLALFHCVGEFTASKLSGAVCLATFAMVYLQYFALFTVFGGTTPGMMVRGLQVVSFTGETPTPRQMLLRSAGYVLSAATFFMGFIWSMWDEDTLTWHDRISRTYLHETDAYAEADMQDAAPSR